MKKYFNTSLFKNHLFNIYHTKIKSSKKRKNPALEGGFFTTGPPRKFRQQMFKV